MSSQAQEMILNIREAFNELLEENTWMDEETRQVAKEKVVFSPFICIYKFDI